MVKNIPNNKFVRLVFFEKKTVNTQQKYTVLNVKRSVYKNLVWSVKKILLNVYLKVSYNNKIKYYDTIFINRLL